MRRSTAFQSFVHPSLHPFISNRPRPCPEPAHGMSVPVIKCPLACSSLRYGGAAPISAPPRLVQTICRPVRRSATATFSRPCRVRELVSRADISSTQPVAPRCMIRRLSKRRSSRAQRPFSPCVVLCHASSLTCERKLTTPWPAAGRQPRGCSRLRMTTVPRAVEILRPKGHGAAKSGAMADGHSQAVEQGAR